MADYTIPPEAEKQIPSEQKLTGKISRYFLRRYPVWPIINHLAQKVVPVHRQTIWYNMGGIALFFLTVQIITGLLLMVYYRPAMPWTSVQRIVMAVPFGNIIRSIHHWSANLMVLFLFLHMFSAFFMKAYRPPREFTWLTGAALMGIVMLFSFSGYLLPWDDLSFFATRVGISEIGNMPVIGSWLAGLARGGAEVTTDTIGRFYLLHVTALPLVILMLVGVHLLFIQIQGVSEPDLFAALPREKKRYHKFFTEFMFGELPVWLFLSALLVALAAAFPRQLVPEADPYASAPAGIKPEWYFLSQYQLLKMFPGKLELVGMVFMTLVPVGMLLMPFYDRSIPTDRRGRIATLYGILVLTGMIVFTVWGYLS
jgi:quinol-cytochrome oxidoreductase complex cytochrome b subunit